MNIQYEEILELEWSDKNENLKLSDFSPSSAKKVWWKCQKNKNHIWLARIFARRNGQGCPFCADKKVLKEDSLGVKFPNLLKEWNYEKNNLDPFVLFVKSGKKVWWKCKLGHEWETMIRHRTSGTNCPYCSNQKCCKDNSFADKFPSLLKEWNFTKNKISPFEVVYGSRKKVWWKCDKGTDHEWLCSVYDRTQLETKCPCCDGHKVVKSTCLMTTHPEICKEWNYDKNKLTPFDFTYASNKKAWWKCILGHEWNSKIYTRTRGDECPFCASSKGEKLIKEFFEKKNIIFDREYRFKDCINIRPLPFDFVIFENNNIIGLVEYQGIHHYEPRDYFGGLKRLMTTREHDKIKYEYCKNKNIPLLVIPYWEMKNTENILENFINQVFNFWKVNYEY